MINEPAKQVDQIILDEGIDKGLARLTEDKIEKTILRVLNVEAGARLKVYVETCVHCGLCSEGCHYYLSHDKDPRYSPAGKVKQTLWEMIRKKGRVGKAFLRQAAVIAATQCNLCKRCAMYCPFGIDVAYLLSVVRRITHLLGMTPQYIQSTAHSHAVSMNQMWVKEDEWPDTLQWQEEEARSEIPKLRMPLEKEGADIMYSVIGPEPKFQAQLIYQTAVLMNVAGLNWTMPATPGWDNSDMAMFTGDNELMGRIKTTQKYTEPVTLHDPCNVVRGGGLHEKARFVVNAICETLIEMHPNREHNYCCCAGGGVINCGPPYKMVRMNGNRIKAEQLFAVKAKGAKTLIAPCHNCHSGLEDINHHYGLDMNLKFIGDILYQVMEKP